MDNELFDEFNSKSKMIGSITRLSDSEISKIQTSIKNKFDIDVNNKWCWESIGVKYETIEYGEKNGLDEIKNLFGNDINIHIVVTDEDTPPWFGFKGKLFDILNILNNLRYVEFFLMDEDCSWILFDTHHNSLIFSKNIENLGSDQAK